ncbi:MAG TPA: hypothetical protein VFL79_02490, partial [Terriglobia bacterium]|nr:hypothetical protein [Terriglobia bacterium]
LREVVMSLKPNAGGYYNAFGGLVIIKLKTQGVQPVPERGHGAVYRISLAHQYDVIHIAEIRHGLANGKVFVYLSKNEVAEKVAEHRTCDETPGFLPCCLGVVHDQFRTNFP